MGFFLKGHLIWGGILAGFFEQKAIICGKFRAHCPTQGDQRRIKTRALSAGFHAVRFCGSRGGPAATRGAQRLSAAGHHGEWNGWNRRAERVDPSALWAGQKCRHAGAEYGPGHDPLAILARKDRGGISVYAQGGRLSRLVKKKLKEVAGAIFQKYRAR